MADRDSTTVESWRPVVGFEGFYSVSDQGRVRRDAPGRGPCVPGRIMKARARFDGYPTVMLACPEHHRLFCIHRLVAEAFIGTRPNGCVINHKNGIKTDNRPGNLEYVTPLENNRHATAHGLRPLGDRNGSRTHPEAYPRGEAHHMVRLSDDDARAIVSLYQSGVRPKDLMARFAIGRTMLSRILKGRDRFSFITPTPILGRKGWAAR